MIYFDQAASSFPKPPEVGKAMIHALNEVGANPGRGGHKLAKEAADIVVETRERAARIFGCSDPRHALFFANATAALNQAIKGLSWSEGDHVIATTFEHNSIRRPLEYIKKQFGVHVTYLPWNQDESSFIQEVKQSINENATLIVMTHASNVTGEVIPIEQTALIAEQYHIPVLVDASQTAGHIPINMREMNIDMLAFPGHKGLLGPQGTGMLLVNGEFEINPLMHGGTGSFSELPDQPSQWPEKLESGTLNTPGIAGMNAALVCYENRNHENVPRETMLTQTLLKGLKQLDGVSCYGSDQQKLRMPMVAFNVLDIPSQEIAMVLDSHYDIAVRAGLHCSPLSHKTLSTTDQGVVRASLSMYNTEEEVEQFLQAVQEITESYKLL
ncbi:aminotransferase class V-fold PLP-dependent enzyme [Lentibacillus sp. CBA3610]|uniref:aminotransferase class V-fold PLP-dependent enzyme n=1 Tax=Lentibacillus sp. CBA3610 TaxID=2518176 RepID=UPI001595634C|nr:aminotransferase class V-fold PLP-dependent enzyme [Lentibacillus sp. CBA3610]QKY70828.1 aminotransferase class V-fold PLP-dependent enzyme [Lentibacillus sp. CBA3610]